MTPAGSLPSKKKGMLSGTLINSLPVPRMKLASVLPIPVANWLKAPAMQVCESVPKRISPGRVWLFRGKV
jgi:hypothetical protein